MTKLAVEKKNVRRPSIGANGASKKQAAEKDLYQLFAENVRDHKDLESRWAVLDESRVEYFRAKDFVKYLTNHPEVKQVLESDHNLDVEDIVNNLLRKSLLARCDRLVKTPRPGKKKLSSWPAHLEIHHEQFFSDNDTFFAWTFEKKNPLWQTLLTFLWPFLTLGICLFPVYPHWYKLHIMYLCAGLLLVSLSLLLGQQLFNFIILVPTAMHSKAPILGIIFYVLAVRAAVFGFVWVVCGHRVWLFPNILADKATFGELFQFWPDKDEDERPKFTVRLFYALLAVVVVLFLRHHTPDDAARARYKKRMTNIIDDVLEWSPTLSLSGMMEKQHEFEGSDSTTV